MPVRPRTRPGGGPAERSFIEGYNRLWGRLDDSLNKGYLNGVKAATDNFDAYIGSAKPETLNGYRALFAAIATRAFGAVWEARANGNREAEREGAYNARQKICQDLAGFAIAETRERPVYFSALSEVAIFLTAIRSRRLSPMPFNSDVSVSWFGIEYLDREERYFVPVTTRADVGKKDYLCITPAHVYDIARQAVSAPNWHGDLNGMPLGKKQSTLIGFVWEGINADATRQATDPKFPSLIGRATQIIEEYVGDFHRNVVLPSQ